MIDVFIQSLASDSCRQIEKGALRWGAPDEWLPDWLRNIAT